MAEDVILSVKNISKCFGDLEVLKGISSTSTKGKRSQFWDPAVPANPPFSAASTSWKPMIPVRLITWENQWTPARRFTS